ncbi:MAG: U32 family peptidase [Nanoarchaeota archaeon]|nr:U32 family peptidase [Nanoarchaeota archaeon]
MESNKPELLLPAKNVENLIVAVNNGADAVYLGMKSFNARISADNFDYGELKEGIDYAHEKGVRIYITLNTLIKNSELKEFFEEVKVAYTLGADAVIIQDLAIAKIIKKEFPGLEVHLSTQARIGNLEAIKKVDYVDRIILPRELSKEELEFLAKNSKVPLEMFVHGALCFSISGICLMSSMIGGRSGNRGACAQPCRRKYNGKYLLSMKDLCLLKEIENIKNLGIVSLKIEGRMRSPFYVATTARVYRKAIDGDKITEKDLQDLELAFNRDFTEGFYNDEKNKISYISPRNRGLFIGKIEDGKLKLGSTIKIGDGISILSGMDIRGQRVEKIICKGKEVESAKKGDVVDLWLQGIKDRDLIYKTSYEYDEKYDILKLNELSAKRGKIVVNRPDISKVNWGKYLPKSNYEPDNQIQLHIKINNFEEAQLEDIKSLYESAYVKAIICDINQKDILKVKELIKEKFYVELPIVVKDSEYNDYIKKIEDLKPEGVIIRNLAFLNCHKNTIVGYQLNMFNDLNIDFFGKGIISPELSFEELKELTCKNFLVFVHGRIVVMTTKNELTKKLTDELGKEFKTEKENEYYKVYNSSEIGLFEEIHKLKEAGLNQFYLEFSGRMNKWLDIYTKIIENKEINLDKIKKGFTKGHFNRGV